MRKRGFSLIELMVVIAIIGILGAVSVPNLTRQMRISEFNSKTKEIFDLLAEARTNAISEKKCGGMAMTEWKFLIDGATAKLECNGTTTTKTVDLDTAIITCSSGLECSTPISFLPGGTQVKIWDGFDFPLANFQFSDNFGASLTKNICINRIAGFPARDDACVFEEETPPNFNTVLEGLSS